MTKAADTGKVGDGAPAAAIDCGIVAVIPVEITASCVKTAAVTFTPINAGGAIAPTADNGVCIAVIKPLAATIFATTGAIAAAYPANAASAVLESSTDNFIAFSAAIAQWGSEDA